MSDEELIALLRNGCNLQQRDGERAADRIEQLKPRLFRCATDLQIYMDAFAVSEAKLSKTEGILARVVDALENVIEEYDLFRKDEYERGLAPLDDEIHEARTTLAEIKGESHEALPDLR